MRKKIVALFIPGVARRGSAVSAKMADNELFVIFYSGDWFFSKAMGLQFCL
jgi:hypothetical protein